MELLMDIAYECKHVTYCPKPEHLDFDLHVAKIIEHHPDGTLIPKLKFIKDFQKPYYITKSHHQHHKQKREKESLAKLDAFKAPNHQLTSEIASKLGIRFFNDPRTVLNSPYLYGNDISSTSIIKYRYMDRYNKFTYANVAVFDIETDTLENIGEITMATLSYKDKVITAVLERVVNAHVHPERQLHEKFDRYLSEYKTKRNINWELRIVKHPHEIIQAVFQRAHEWMPDIIAIWNIDFDLPVVLKTLEKEHIDPADIFSDPSVPKPFRHFKYHQGRKTTTTNAGIVKNLLPAEQWHYADHPASFIFLDAMCVYYNLRLAKQNEPSYKLDYILDKELGIRKLKFQESDHIPPNTIEWHKFMQQNYPLEYVIYNVFDCISVEELDEKTLDLSLAYAQGIHCTDPKNFTSQPKRVVDQMHWFLLKRGYVIGCSGDLVHPLDDQTVSLKGWVNSLN